ncbi:glycoside hydrolase family 30 protein [Halothermothrix orenii]|uniref:Glycoside hydrolase family 30 n=1 Tax=Halothermothrix orenii (strain H 168 / OCM 544 / DSM 9562) TaxID=373903 RepID=B8D1V0_HALOH|nr:glycoside hydrolase family 30 protein [Halothermothrix orenii]ACL69177.1 glycoside hydrolase family 30 [Halothermothrix orenii H 168]
MNSISVILTARDTGDRLSLKGEKVFKSGIGRQDIDLELYPDTRYQKIIGFGGAFTEAAAYTLSKISSDKRLKIIESYFDRDKGLGYNMGRVHINSCDFALENYTYVEDGDRELKTFDISRERQWVIPLIRDAIKARGGEIKLLASPWSPPAWMKSNENMNYGGKLLPEYRDVWAKYYTKYIKAFQEEGLNIWGITVQNEPAAVQTWDSCTYTAEEERDFVKNHLGPVMHEEGLGDINILIWDHNRDIIVDRVKPILDDLEAAKYVWGTAFHWYVSEDFDNVGQVHEMYPDKHLLFTEGCQEGGCQIGEWFTGERYGRNIIGDLNNWTEGYLDWNMVLNEEGGPNHVGNYCDAPVIVDTNTEEIYYNSSYYYIGHFSKYIRPGAVRIGVSCTNDNLKATSFLNSDGSIILIVMNETDNPTDFAVSLDNKVADLTLPAHAIATYIIT